MFEKTLNGTEFNRLNDDEKYSYLLSLKQFAAIAAQYAGKWETNRLELSREPDMYQWFFVDLNDVLAESIERIEEILENNEPLPIAEDVHSTKKCVAFYRSGGLWSSKQTWGGPGRGQGRHREPGYDKPVKMRFLSQDEEVALKEFTPRQRVEILLAALPGGKPNKSLVANC